MIPNTLTYGGLAAAAVIAIVQGTVAASLTGFLVAGGCAFALYLVRAMAGGDVKLLAALGALLGYPLSLDLLFFGVLFGGAWSIFVLAMKGMLLATLRDIWLLIRSLLYPQVPLFVPAEGVHVAGGAVIAAATVWIALSVLLSTYAAL